MINLKNIVVRGSVLQFESMAELKAFKQEIAAIFNCKLENVNLTYQEEKENGE